MLLLQGKLIGGITGPIQPFVIGLLLGPAAVGTYDALVRLSRVSKIVVGLLTSALLPVASRLDERGSSTAFQRLGELGLIMLPMFTVPPLVAAAVLSPDIMRIWIGPLLVPYAVWMGIELSDSDLRAISRNWKHHFPDASRNPGSAESVDGPAIGDLGRGIGRNPQPVRRTGADSWPGCGRPGRIAMANRHPAPGAEPRSPAFPESRRNPSRNSDRWKRSAIDISGLHSI